MKLSKTKFALMAVATLMCALPVMSQQLDNLKYPKLNPLKTPEIKQVTLDNGLKLYLVSDKRLPEFNMSVRVNAGSYLEPANRVGLVSILGQSLRTGGTKKWTGDEVDELLEAVGASVETFGGLSNCGASVNSLSEYSDLALEVLAQILQYPTFDEDKIELARVQERSGISRRNDDPMGIGRREFNKLIYGPESVYARNTEYKTINAVTRDDLLAFHAAWFKPNFTQIAIWGDFDQKKLLAKIRSEFGGWQKGETLPPPLPKVEYKDDRSVYYAEKTDVNQSNILMGHIGGLLTDADHPAKIIMNKILGGGLGNRMFNTIRSKEGLAYATMARYTSNISYPGVFFSYTGTKSETTGKAAHEMVKVAKSMQTDPPTDEEMKRGKDSYLNSFVFNFDSKSEVVNRMMVYDHYGLPSDFLQKEKEGVEKVTADDVVAAAKANLHPDMMKVLIVGKAEDFDIPLADLGLGPVAVLDISIPPAEEKTELEMTPENIAKGKEILDRAVVTHGGLANFKKINSTVTKGTITIETPNGPFPLQFEDFKVLPDKQYRVVNVMGREILDISNGAKGWKTDQATMSIVPKNEDEMLKEEEDRRRSMILVFKTSDNPSYKAVYNGSGTVKSKSVDFVVIVDEKGDEICRFGFDATTTELVCKYYQGETFSGKGLIEEFYVSVGDYSGVRIPNKMEQSLEGQKTLEVSYSELTINADISDDKFNEPQ